MKTLLISTSLFLSVLFTQAQGQTNIGDITTATSYELAGATVTVSLSTNPVNIPGKLNYTFQIYFGDGYCAVANVPTYSNDSFFTASHTYTKNGTYTITYILGYADYQNAGPDGLQLATATRTINVTDAVEVATAVTSLSSEQTTIFCANKQVTVKSELEVTSIQLFNVAGQEVQSQNFGTTGTLNMPLSSTLTTGIYIVAVKGSDNKTLTKKISVN